jgi:hypothetical protein
LIAQAFAQRFGKMTCDYFYLKSLSAGWLEKGQKRNQPVMFIKK